MYLSIKLSLISVEMALGVLSPSLNTLSITDSSVLVVSSPQKEIQSLTTMPAPITSLPRFTVPAYNSILSLSVCFKLHNALPCEYLVLHYFHYWFWYICNFHTFLLYIRLTTRGTCRREDNSSRSSMDVLGWTYN